MPDIIDERPRGLSTALHDFTRALERAHTAGGVDGVVVPLLAPLLGTLLPGTHIVSRGPWALQRSVLLALLEHPARRVSARDAHDGADGPIVDRSLTLAPDAAQDLVLHAVSRRAGVAIHDLRQGSIARHQWGRLADATQALTELELEVVDGEPGDVVLRIHGGAVLWRMVLQSAVGPTNADAGSTALADVLIDLSADECGIWLRALDGRVEPPVVQQVMLVGDRLVWSNAASERACIADDAERRVEELAAARHAEHEADLNAAWTELEGGEGDPLWTPPAPEERGPSDR